MKTYIFLLLGVVSSVSVAFTAPDFHQEYSCEVVKSNQQNVPVGTQTLRPVILAELKSSGFVALANPRHRLIEFYGPLETMNTTTVSADYLTLAKLSGEIQGSVRIKPRPEGDGILLEMALTLMDRAYDQKTGEQSFVLGNQMELYTLSCQ